MISELFVDTNVLLKIFFSEKDFQPVLKVLTLIEEKEIRGYLSTVSVSELVTVLWSQKTIC